ncbi:MAG TPA: winged helix-turn-helix domain-containing protein [Acidimicrobiales bacterium]|nr:winged helix-turn-helix domain-containing protein [Acidimicrobiales bacterium]
MVAPAGSGKSRLLAHIGALFTGPVAWCDTPEPVPRSEPALVAWIWGGLANALDVSDAEDPPEHLDDLIATARPDSGPLLIAMDDVHLIEGSEAETALDALIARLPGSWRVILASRMNLSIDLSRLRVSGDVVDIGPDELRFRTWEVEELFRDIYGQPLVPEDVAALTRRTAGWAAYLQMFYLATSRRPVAERRIILGSMQHRTRLVSEYLARHVLSGLDPSLQDFLIRTSVLRRPSGRLADEFLGWESGSAAMLAELERRRLFTEHLADDSYRYHAVLVSYLDGKLVETFGLDAAQAEHRRAGQLLETAGWTEEALAAYARAEDWEAMARLVGRTGAEPVALDDAWADALPPSVLGSDPLLLMAQARSAIGRGSLDEAAALLRQAETVAASVSVAERCRAQREQVLAWTETNRPMRNDWIGWIRRATQRQPAAAPTVPLPGPTGRFAEGCALFLAGDMAGGQRVLRSVSAHPDAPAIAAAGAAFITLVCATMLGRPPAAESVAQLREEVEASGIRWLNRMIRAALVSNDKSGDDAIEDLIAACEREADRWGAAVILAADGIRRLVRAGPGAEAALSGAAESFRVLGAATIESTLVAYASLAAVQSGQPELSRRLALRARAAGTALDVPGAVAVASLALAADGDSSAAGDARRLLEGFGTWAWHADLVPVDAHAPAVPDGGRSLAATPATAAPTPAGRPPGRMRCLGRFELEIDGVTFDEASAKPMERSLLHLLASRAGSAVHREELVAALWPEADSEAGRHRLQVAVSSLRKLTGKAGGELIVRAGDSYRISLPEGSSVDVVEFQAAIGRASEARSGSRRSAERVALEAAFALYAGPLLPADGPADWVVETRRWLVNQYTDVCARLAAILLDEDEPRPAGRVARSGLAADRYRDDLWKLVIDGAEGAGNHAEAEQARRDYESVLSDLGV